MNVLVLNAGSSSLKFQVITTDLDKIKDNQDERLCRGAVERIGGEAVVTIEGGKKKRTSTVTLTDINAAIGYIIRSLTPDAEIHAVGHRVGPRRRTVFGIRRDNRCGDEGYPKVYRAGSAA